MLRHDMGGEKLKLHDGKPVYDLRSLHILSFAWVYADLYNKKVVDEELTHEFCAKYSVRTKTTFLINNSKSLAPAFQWFLKNRMDYSDFCEAMGVPISPNGRKIDEATYSFTLEVTMSMFAAEWMESFWLAKSLCHQRYHESAITYESQSSLSNWLNTKVKLQNPFVETVSSFKTQDSDDYSVVDSLIYAFLTVATTRHIPLIDCLDLKTELWYMSANTDINFQNIAPLKINTKPMSDWVPSGVYEHQ